MAILKLWQLWSTIPLTIRAQGHRRPADEPCMETCTAHTAFRHYVRHLAARHAALTGQSITAYRYLERHNQCAKIHRWDVCDPIDWLDRWMVDPDEALR